MEKKEKREILPAPFLFFSGDFFLPDFKREQEM